MKKYSKTKNEKQVCCQRFPRENFSKKNSGGFTLIELLIVVAIISVLSGVVLLALNSARAKARDSFRASSVLEMQKAVNLYYFDYGSYPSTGGAWWGACSGFGSHPTSGPTGYIPNLAPTYISVLPLDPSNTNAVQCFVYRSDGTDYFLMAFWTYEGTPPTNRLRPAFPLQKNFAVYTPGAAGW